MACESLGVPIYHLKDHEIKDGYDFEIFTSRYDNTFVLFILKGEEVVCDKGYRSLNEAKKKAEEFLEDHK